MRADTQGEASKRISSDRIDERSCVELVESVNSIILRWNADFLITYLNDYGERFFGYRRDELVGQSILGTIVPETSGEGVDMAEIMRNIFRHPERYVNNENENLRKNGSRVWVSWTNRAVTDDEGHVAEILSIGNDITDRKRMEKELRRARDELEARVQSRTRELQASNEALRKEVLEHRKAEDAVRESERKFKAIFDQTFEFIGLMSPDGVLLAANRTALKFEGIEEADAIGKLLWETPWWTHSRDLQEKVRNGIRLAAGGELVRFEVTHKDAKGNLRYGDFSIKPVRDEAGQVVLLIPESRDITEAKLAEEALRDSEERFRATFEQAAVGIAHVLPDGRFIRVNEKFCEITGYARQELVTRTFQSITDPRDLAADLKLVDQLLAGQTQTYTIEKRYIRKDGSRVWVNLTVSLVRDAEGSPKYFISIVKDITDRKRIEQALKESEARLHSIFRAAPTGIGLVVNRTITEVNARLCEMTGYAREELLGRSARMLYPAEEDYEFVGREKYRQISEKGTGTVETRWLRRDGQILDILLSSTPMDPADLSAGVTFTALDITERKRAERALEHAKAQAELYVDLMSHDISNMNQALLGFLELAELAIPMEPEQRELIEKPIEIVNHSAQLINNVRKLEHLQQARCAKKAVDMCGIISRVTEERSRVEGRHVSINYRMPDTCFVAADDMLQDVFSNIVENAIRHSSGPVAIDIAIEPLEAGGRKYFRVSIADNGPGIPDDQKSQVFTFMQGYKVKPGRRGLGLCLVKTLVEHFDGRVWVENRVAENYRMGAKFVVELPAA